MANTDVKTGRGSKSAAQTTNKIADAAEKNAVKRTDTAQAALNTAAQAGASAAHATRDTADAAASATRDMTDTAFSQARFEVPEVVRSLAEQGLNQTREAYGRMKAATEQATGMMEESFGSARDNMRDIQLKALDAAQANAEATFDFTRKLLGVNSAAEAVQLQASFARERFEALIDYSKEMQSTLTKAGADASKPAKAMLDRTVNSSKQS